MPSWQMFSFLFWSPAGPAWRLRSSGFYFRARKQPDVPAVAQDDASIPESNHTHTHTHTVAASGTMFIIFFTCVRVTLLS